MPTVRRIALIVRRVAALPSSQDLTGPSLGDEPCVLKGRCGGTDEFLGRGVLFPQSPWTSVQGGRPLDKCLVQRHADAVWRKWPAAVSAAVNRSPVITTRKEDYSSLVRGAPVDRRGHIRVRRSGPGPLAVLPSGLVIRRLVPGPGHYLGQGGRASATGVPRRS